MKPHQLAVYSRGGALYVVPSLPSAKGMMSLDVVFPVVGGYDGLADALRLAEKEALKELERPPPKRKLGDTKLLHAAGAQSFQEFIQGTTMCTIVRVPDYVLVMKSVPGPKGKAFLGTPRQDQLPPNTSIDELARVACQCLEEW
jgi:hypothetical protein